MTTRERLQAMVEDVRDCETLAELQALVDLGPEFDEVGAAGREIAAKRKQLESVNPNDRLRELLSQLQTLKAQPASEERIQVAFVKRAPRKYRLLKDDVGWSTKPQVHAVMRILRTIVKVGEVADEDQIVAAMEEHADLLNTRQPPRRIWDYYKGSSAEGLLEHGNIDRV